MILVTGATGTNGRLLLQSLSRAGVPARAMVRKLPSHPITEPSATETVVADFDEPTSLERALQGVTRAFLVTNSSERAEAQQLAFVDAARRAGVRHIVYLSQLHARRNSPVRFLHYHGVVEEAIAAAGIAFTHLRPNLYMQGLLDFSRMIATQGRFFAPIGGARVSLVDVRDLAAVACAALTEPGHEGKIYDLTGPVALTHPELATAISRHTGTPVDFIGIPPEAFLEALLGFGMPRWQAEGLVEDYAHYQRGEAADVSDAVRRVTGTPARSFEDFLAVHGDAFRAPVASAIPSV